MPGSNGDFENLYGEFTASSAANAQSIVNTRQIFGNYSVKLAPNNENSFRCSKYYFYSGYGYVESFSSGLFKIMVYDGGTYNNVVMSQFDMSKIGSWQRVNKIYDNIYMNVTKNQFNYI